MKYDVWPPQRRHMRRRFTPTLFTTAVRLLAADRRMSSRSSPDWAKYNEVTREKCGNQPLESNSFQIFNSNFLRNSINFQRANVSLKIEN